MSRNNFAPQCPQNGLINVIKSKRFIVVDQMLQYMLHCFISDSGPFQSFVETLSVVPNDTL